MIARSPQAVADQVRDGMFANDSASKSLGMQLLEVAPGAATLQMTVRGDMLNGHESCHGGFIAALADSAFAYACNSYNELTVAFDQVYICGPFQMNDEAEAALLAAGVPQERIHIERFGVAQAAAEQVGAVIHEAKPGDAEVARVLIIRDGLHREIEFRKDQPSILDCATAAGLEVPFSCTSGVCGTCRAKVLEGEVRMERNFALDKNEVAAGFVLSCQAHPLTERVVLSFDER